MSGEQVERLRAELAEEREHAEQVEDLLRIAHETSNRSEAERAHAVAELGALKAAIERFRQRHSPHDCHHDHVKTSTPIPCINAGLCRCGSNLPCRELAALDASESRQEAK